jgi:phosphoribosylformylglycinamidine synthase
VTAVHDCSSGGLAQAVAEMAIKGEIGATINEPAAHNPVLSFFGEDQGRYVLTVTEGNLSQVQSRAEKAGISTPLIGRTGGKSVILGSAKPVSVEQLHQAYESWFPDYMNGEI